MNYFLRELCRDDIEEINAWRNDREIISSLAAPFRFIGKNIDDAWYESYISNRSNNIRLAITEDNGGKIIGATYLTEIDWVAKSGELSIWIGKKDKQKKGAGKFAIEAMLSHAFSDLGLNRVFLTVLDNNIIARNLYLKFGFVEEAVLRQVVFKNGEFKDMILMAILASDYFNGLASDIKKRKA